MTDPHSTDGTDVPLHTEELTHDVSMPPIREISLRAHWLDSLSSGERDGLIDLPLAVVEQMFMEWRRRTHPDE